MMEHYRDYCYHPNRVEHNITTFSRSAKNTQVYSGGSNAIIFVFISNSALFTFYLFFLLELKGFRIKHERCQACYKFDTLRELVEKRVTMARQPKARNS